MADVVQEELTDAQREALQYTSNPEKLLRNSRALPTYEEEEAPGSTIRMPEREELMEAARQELMEEEKIRLPKEQAEKPASAEPLVHQGRDRSDGALRGRAQLHDCPASADPSGTAGHELFHQPELERLSAL